MMQDSGSKPAQDRGEPDGARRSAKVLPFRPRGVGGPGLAGSGLQGPGFQGPGLQGPGLQGPGRFVGSGLVGSGFKGSPLAPRPLRPAAPALPGEDSDSYDDLAQYEQDRAEQDEEDESVNYPRRMLMNVIAVMVLTVLIAAGVWLADAITYMERNQDCILQGRQNCAPIEIAAPVRR